MSATARSASPKPGYITDADVGDGKLTIKDAEGTTLGEFTADQATGTDTEVTLPATFSGDYDDLINKPDIGDGKITIVDADGDPVGEFTVNQAGDTEISLPEFRSLKTRSTSATPTLERPALVTCGLTPANAHLSCRSMTTAMIRAIPSGLLSVAMARLSLLIQPLVMATTALHLPLQVLAPKLILMC